MTCVKADTIGGPGEAEEDSHPTSGKQGGKTMWKATLVVLAASWIFPPLVSWASPPEEGPPAAAAAASGPAVKIFGKTAPEMFQLPEEFESLTPEKRQEMVDSYLWWVDRHRRPVSPPRPSGFCLAASREEADLCAAAARISYSRPCLAAGDCPALEDWKEVMGTPGLRPAPRSTVRAAERSPSKED